MATKKTCRVCKKTKTVSSFPKKAGNKDGLATLCKLCNTEKVKAWQRDNPEYWKTQIARRDLIYKQRKAREYGLTLEEVDKLMEIKNCEICGNDLNGKPNIDHDHATGKVRGILCGPCNRGLGIFKDDIATLQKACQYLLTHKPFMPL